LFSLGAMRVLVLCLAVAVSAYGGVADDEKEILRLEATIKDAWLKA
jgi:hypothetical protein